jgi:hypothetical protein
MGRIRTGRIRPGLAMPVPVRPPRPSGEHEPAPCGVSGSREGQRQGAPSSRHRTSGGSRHQLGIKGSTLGSRRIRGASIAPRADSDKRCAPEQHHRLIVSKDDQAEPADSPAEPADSRVRTCPPPARRAAGRMSFSSMTAPMRRQALFIDFSRFVQLGTGVAQPHLRPALIHRHEIFNPRHHHR